MADSTSEERMHTSDVRPLVCGRQGARPIAPPALAELGIRSHHLLGVRPSA